MFTQNIVILILLLAKCLGDIVNPTQRQSQSGSSTCACHLVKGGSSKERFFLAFLDLYSSKALFITGDSVNFLFVTSLSLPSKTQFMIPGNSWAMIFRDSSGSIFDLVSGR